MYRLSTWTQTIRTWVVASFSLVLLDPCPTTQPTKITLNNLYAWKVCLSKLTIRTFQSLDDDGIFILNGVLHSHLAGREMRLRHVRDGRELPLILEDSNYDFNYQASSSSWSSHRNPSIHIERACSVEPVDKIWPVFIYCMFNISWIRKTVFENKIYFAYFLKALAYHKPKVFNLSSDFFKPCSLFV